MTHEVEIEADDKVKDSFVELARALDQATIAKTRALLYIEKMKARSAPFPQIKFDDGKWEDGSLDVQNALNGALPKYIGQMLEDAKAAADAMVDIARERLTRALDERHPPPAKPPKAR